MPSGITLTNVDETTIPTPPTDKNTVFFDVATGEPSYKDDAGVVTSLVGIPGQGVPVGGTTGQVLSKIDATNYNTQWTTPATGFANPMTTSQDLIVGGVAGAAGRLGVGSNGQVLGVSGGLVGWVAAGGTYTGTAGSITLTGSAFSIDATYVGQTSITTLGTISTGTWNATAIGATKGGTGQTGYAAGDLLYASSTTALAKLSVGTNGDVLTLAAGVPTWAVSPGLRNTTSALATSGSVAIDCALGDYFTLALAGNVSALTFSNLPGSGKGATLMVRITQDSTPRTVAWPASFKWAGGAAPSVSTGSGVIDVLAITTFDNGTTWDATLAKGWA